MSGLHGFPLRAAGGLASGATATLPAGTYMNKSLSPWTVSRITALMSILAVLLVFGACDGGHPDEGRTGDKQVQCSSAPIDCA